MKQVSLFRSLVSHWVGLVLGVIIGFVLSPFVVHSLGKDLYGAWTIVVSITGQLVVLDLGIRNAVVRYMAMHRTAGETNRSSELLSNAAFIQGVLSLIGFSALSIVSIYWLDWFDVPQEFSRATQIALLLMSIDAALELASGVFFAGLAASERYDILNGVNVGRLLLNAVLVIAVLKAGFGIIGIASVALGVRCLQRILVCKFALRDNPGVKLRPRYLNKTVAKKIGSYGLLAAVSVAAIRIIYQLDVLVVGITMSSAAVTIYAIPVILIEQFRMVSQSTATILTPRLSGLSISDDQDTTRLLLLKWAGLGQIIALAIGVPLLITGGDFILLWMGEDFSSCRIVLQILTVPFFFILPALGFSSFLYAIDKHGLYAKITIAEAVLNLPLSFLLVQFFGLPGVALGTLIPGILFRGIVLPMQSVRLAEIPFPQYIKAGYLKFVGLGAGYAILLIALRLSIGAHSWWAFLLNNGIGFSIFCGATYLFWLDAEDKAYLKRRLGIE